MGCTVESKCVGEYTSKFCRLRQVLHAMILPSIVMLPDMLGGAF